MEKNVYLLKRGSVEKNGQFFWYDDMVFTSMKKVRNYIDQGFQINEGYSYNETTPWFNDDIYIEYKCLSTDQRVMEVRFMIKKVKVNHW